MTTSRDMTIEEFYAIHRTPADTCTLFTEINQKLRARDDEYRDWALAQCTSMQDCWETVPDSQHLVWIAAQPGVLTDDEKLRFALFCCELIQPQLEDFLPIAAITTLRRRILGETTMEELQAASWAADVAWEDSMDPVPDTYIEQFDPALAVVSTSVYVSPDADSTDTPDVPDIFEISEWAIEADVEWTTLADCLRTHTKPNFTKKADTDE